MLIFFPPNCRVDFFYYLFSSRQIDESISIADFRKAVVVRTRSYLSTMISRLRVENKAVSTGSSKLDRSSEFGPLKLRSTSDRRRDCWRLSIGPSSPNRSNFGIGLWDRNILETMADAHRRPPTCRMIQRSRQHYHHTPLTAPYGRGAAARIRSVTSVVARE